MTKSPTTVMLDPAMKKVAQALAKERGEPFNIFLQAILREYLEARGLWPVKKGAAK